MKKIVLYLLFSNFLFAQGGLKISAGPNFSTFLNDDDSEMVIGYTFGLEYEYYLSKSFSVKSGLFYSKEGGLLKDKIRKPSVLEEGSRTADIFYEDLYAIIGYIKIPILFGYSFDIFKNNISKFEIGGSLLLPIKDYSYTDNYRFAFIYYVGETDFNFEYYSIFGGESSFYKNSLQYAFDISLVQYYKKFFLELAVNYHLGDFGYVTSFSQVKKNLISGKFGIGYSF